MMLDAHVTSAPLPSLQFIDNEKGRVGALSDRVTSP